MDYKDILYNYAEYFEQSDVASTVIRWIGWEIIKLLHSICDLCQGLWEAVFQALDFTPGVCNEGWRVLPDLVQPFCCNDFGSRNHLFVLGA